MMKLSDHFNLAEFTFSQTSVRHGIDNTPTDQIIKNMLFTAGRLEQIRTCLGDVALRISSGYRSPALNQAVGSGPASAHVTGFAVDFTCAPFGTPRKICQKIMAAGYQFDQLILEGVSNTNADGAWVHISFAPAMRNQVLTMKRINGKTVYEKGLT